MNGADDEFFERLEKMANEHFRYVTDAMEPMLDRTTEVRAVPMPLDWHPAYADRTWLLDWLNEVGPYARLNEIRLSFPHRATWVALSEPSPTASATEVRVLSRRRCAGPAPYVGRPFVYEWNACVDEFGRAIVGESRIQLLQRDHGQPPRPERRS